MEAVSRLVEEAKIPGKEQPKGPSRSKNPQEFPCPAASENKNPNFLSPSPKPKQTISPAVKSAKGLKSAPRTRIRERKFIVAKKCTRKDGEGIKVVCPKCEEKFGGNVKKCLCVAYENLRASQEEFFKIKDGEVDGQIDGADDFGKSSLGQVEDMEKSLLMHDLENDMGEGGEGGDEFSERCVLGEIDPENPIGVSTIKRRRDKVMEAARNSIPKEGRVMHLVKAFEKLRTIPNPEEDDKADKNVVNWSLPGLRPPKPSEESEAPSALFSPSDLLLTAENLGLDSRASLSSSWDR